MLLKKFKDAYLQEEVGKENELMLGIVRMIHGLGNVKSDLHVSSLFMRVANVTQSLWIESSARSATLRDQCHPFIKATSGPA